MLPCENSLAGRVPDMHHLLPESGLFVVGEHFQRVEHCLLAPQAATLATLKRAHSHAVALGQVRRVLRELNLTAGGRGRHRGCGGDGGGAWNNPEDCAIASSLAAELFGLKILRAQRRGCGAQHHPLLRAAPHPRTASARTRRA